MTPNNGYRCFSNLSKVETFTVNIALIKTIKTIFLYLSENWRLTKQLSLVKEHPTQAGLFTSKPAKHFKA